MIQAENISFRYKNSHNYILQNINLTVGKGEVIGIVGLSGSGKTTLINILNGIIPHRIPGEFHGRVFLNGQDISNKDIAELATIIGTVFQDPDSQIIFSNVEDEIAFGPENLCVAKDEIVSRINEVIKLLKIEKLRNRDPNKLSGGEKQLVVIASILSLNAENIILDESMSQIDQQGKQLIKEAIINMKKAGKTIVMVEHDMKNLEVADRVYLISDGNLRLYNGVLV